MTTTTTDRVHLHRDDYPKTLRLLEDLRGGRPAQDWKHIGFEQTEYGAFVAWDELLGSWLSSTEKAVVHIARGTAGLERAGGPAPRLVATVVGTVAGVCQPSGRGDEWMAAITGGVDLARLDELDPDLARHFHDLDDAAQDVLLQIGASDCTDADRAAHATKMRRQLAALAREVTCVVEELDS